MRMWGVLLLMLALGGLLMAATPLPEDVSVESPSVDAPEVASTVENAVTDVDQVELELALVDLPGVVDEVPVDTVDVLQAFPPAGQSEAIADRFDDDSGVTVRKFGLHELGCCHPQSDAALAFLRFDAVADHVPVVTLARGGVIAD